ncbi:MAG TPA: hypothetical protein VL137_15785 [Polyangiaceae bacterium]|nr:hypothetical protein [Polyangiaceae bacterium]
MTARLGGALSVLSLLLATSNAFAHKAAFKSPAPGMHFTAGQPLVIFADIFDERDGKGFIVCPAGETISNALPAPDYSEPPRVAQCSGGGTPTGWPQFEVLIDGVLQTDIDSNLTRIPHTIAFNHDHNPDPIGFFRFSAPTDALAPGDHEIVVRAYFSNDGVAIDTLDSDPMTVAVDAPPAKMLVTLTADMTGPVNWDNVIVVGNGHRVDASGALVIHNSLITGLGALDTDGLTGTVDSIDIADSIFEDTGAVTLSSAGDVAVLRNEFRANNRLQFEASNPAVPFVISLSGDGANQKLFQGNRVGAGQMDFKGAGWLIGGDDEQASNVFIGPRTVLNISSSDTVIRGNYSHHNYRGAWSQGYNFYYEHAGSNVLTEHNFIRDSSWPVQDLAGEFRYNVVYGYGHTWIRTAKANASIHHNIFTPGGDEGLNAGIECYGGETGLQIYNNTFDGGGADFGDFSNATIGMSGGSQVSSLRNNLVTFSRDAENGMGTERIVGGAAAYLYADYNAFYSPDNSNKSNYDFVGAGAHDASDGADGQLADTPFAGTRVMPLPNRMIENVIDEAAVWQGTQTVSQVLALFRERYTPMAGSSVIDAGDPQDNDAQGRVADIGAIDLDGHDQDQLGKFGDPTAVIPPTPTPPTGGGSTGLTTGGMSGTMSTGGVVGTAGTAAMSAAGTAPYHAGGTSTGNNTSTSDSSKGCGCLLSGRDAPRGTAFSLVLLSAALAALRRRASAAYSL